MQCMQRTRCIFYGVSRLWWSGKTKNLHPSVNWWSASQKCPDWIGLQLHRAARSTLVWTMDKFTCQNSLRAIFSNSQLWPFQAQQLQHSPQTYLDRICANALRTTSLTQSRLSLCMKHQSSTQTESCLEVICSIWYAQYINGKDGIWESECCSTAKR